MFSFINSAVTTGVEYINMISGGNQFVGGVLTATVLAGLAWVFRDMPRSMLNWAQKQTITTISITNLGNERTTFNRIANDVGENGFRGLSRTLKVDCFESYTNETGWVEYNDINVGYGRHYRIYKRRLLIVDRAMFKENNGDVIKETIDVTLLGRNRQILHDYVQALLPKPSRRVRTLKYAGQGRWDKDREIVGNGLIDLALDPSVESLIRREMDSFVNNRETYERLGLPYKLSVILHGLPGSGKTSLIRAIAKEYGFNIGSLNMNDISDEHLVNALTAIPKRTIILMEDFDSCAGINSVVKKTDDDKKDEEDPVKSLMSAITSVSRSGFLNALDGVVPLNDVMIIMTTNHIDRIDDAVKRAGRTDLMIDLPPVSPEAIRVHFTRLYPELANWDIDWGVLPGCVINKVKRLALNDTNKCRELLEFYFANPEVAEEEQRGGVERLEEMRKYTEALAKQGKADGSDKKRRKELESPECDSVASDF